MTREEVAAFDHDIETVAEVVRVTRATMRVQQKQDAFFDTLHDLLTELRVHRTKKRQVDTTISLLRTRIHCQELRIKHLESQLLEKIEQTEREESK